MSAKEQSHATISRDEAQQQDPGASGRARGLYGVPKTRVDPLATKGQRETDIQSAVSSRGSEQQRDTMMMTNGEAGRGTRVAAVVVVAAVVAAGVVLAWAVLGARAAGAAFPGQNGKIAFTSERDGNQEVYEMDANGQAQTRLTNNSALEVAPMFSPDGTKIAFVSNRDGNREVYVMDSNGQNQT